MLAVAYSREKNLGRTPASLPARSAGRQGHVEPGPKPSSKLCRGIWSRLHAHLLLKGPVAAPCDVRFIEDDYRRLARRTFEHNVFGLR
jgi:hypothetical protein